MFVAEIAVLNFKEPEPEPRSLGEVRDPDIGKVLQISTNICWMFVAKNGLAGYSLTITLTEKV